MAKPLQNVVASCFHGVSGLLHLGDEDEEHEVAKSGHQSSFGSIILHSLLTLRGQIPGSGYW
jgi:hypothetical protein